MVMVVLKGTTKCRCYLDAPSPPSAAHALLQPVAVHQDCPALFVWLKSFCFKLQMPQKLQYCDDSLRIGGPIHTQAQLLFGTHLLLTSAANLTTSAMKLDPGTLIVTIEPRENRPTSSRGAKPRYGDDAVCQLKRNDSSGEAAFQDSDSQESDASPEPESSTSQVKNSMKTFP